MDSAYWNVTTSPTTINDNITLGNTTDVAETSISVARLINLCCRPIWILMGTIGMYMIS